MLEEDNKKLNNTNKKMMSKISTMKTALSFFSFQSEKRRITNEKSESLKSFKIPFEN